MTCAVYSRPIMIHNDPDILSLHFLPILRKSLKKAQVTRNMEEKVIYFSSSFLF